MIRFTCNTVFLLAIFFDVMQIRRYYRAPMSARLPKTVDVRKYADTGRHLQGVLDGSLCQRLSGAIDHFEGDIEIDLQFERDVENRRIITGEVSTNVAVICQRCLEDVVYPLQCNVALGVIIDETQAEQLPSSLEPVLIDDEPLSLVDLVEDELILALPSVITHEQCEAPLKLDKPVVEEQKRDNPFAVLKNFKVSE